MEVGGPGYDHDYDYPPSTSNSMVSEDDVSSYYRAHSHSISIASASEDGAQSQYMSAAPENGSCRHNQPHAQFMVPEDGSHQAQTPLMSVIPENGTNLHARAQYQFQSPSLSPVAIRRKAMESDGHTRSPSISPLASRSYGRVTELHEDHGNSSRNANPNAGSGQSHYCTSPYILQVDAANTYNSGLQQSFDLSQGHRHSQGEVAPVLQVNSRNPHQDNMANDFLEQFLQNSDTAANLDVVCALLELSPELWHFLCMLRKSQEAQAKLRPHLRQLFEVPPAGLWELLVSIKSMYFEVLPDDFVERLRSLPRPISQSHSHSPSAAPLFEGTPQTVRGYSGNKSAALRPSRATSPSSGFGLSSPRQEEYSSQTRCTTPGSAIPPHSRSTSRSRHSTPKGRAPPGYKYVCPYPNCRKGPFTNTGNFTNHMLLYHAKHTHSKPETFLQPNSTPPQDNGEEWALPATTDASDQPMNRRDLSQDIRDIGGVMPTASQEGFNEESGHSVDNSSPEGFHQMNIPAFSASNDLTSNFPFQDTYPRVPVPGQLYPVHPPFMNPDSMPEDSPTSDGSMQFCLSQANMFRSYRGNR